MWRRRFEADWNSLQAEANPQRRGLQFEELLLRLLQSLHFNVVRDSGAAHPRQTDLSARYGQDSYLIEAKWQQARLDVGDLAQMKDRLSETHGSVTGVVMAVGGFSEGLISSLERRRERTILLFGPEELEAIIGDPLEFPRLLNVKRDHFLQHGKVHLEERAGAPPREASDLPGSVGRFVGADGEQVALSLGGGYGRNIMVQEWPDLDFGLSGGQCASIDLDIRVDGESGILSVLQSLDRLGWISDRGQWVIVEGSLHRVGLGSASLLGEIPEWQQRRDVAEETHHTEEVTYFDQFDGGFLIFMADITCDEARQVLYSNLHFKLSGIPLDIAPFLETRKETGCLLPAYFRPESDVDDDCRGWFDAEEVPLEVIAYIVNTDDEEIAGHRDWVTGVAVKNPFLESSIAPEGWPLRSDDTSYIICDLPHHHPMSSPVPGYWLRGFRMAPVSGGRMLRFVADW